MLCREGLNIEYRARNVEGRRFVERIDGRLAMENEKPCNLAVLSHIPLLLSFRFRHSLLDIRYSSRPYKRNKSPITT